MPTVAAYKAADYFLLSAIPEPLAVEGLNDALAGDIGLAGIEQVVVEHLLSTAPQNFGSTPADYENRIGSPV